MKNISSDKLTTIKLMGIISIAEKHGIDGNDTIDVIIYAMENNICPFEAFKKAFFE
jgi:hypothetical protein